jgi:hypothetical protein
VLNAERLEHVPTEVRARALAQQVVRARGKTARDLPGNGKDVAPELEGEIGRDERARALAASTTTVASASPR